VKLKRGQEAQRSKSSALSDLKARREKGITGTLPILKTQISVSERQDADTRAHRVTGRRGADEESESEAESEKSAASAADKEDARERDKDEDYDDKEPSVSHHPVCFMDERRVKLHVNAVGTPAAS